MSFSLISSHPMPEVRSQLFLPASCGYRNTTWSPSVVTDGKSGDSRLGFYAHIIQKVGHFNRQWSESVQEFFLQGVHFLGC